MIKLAVPLILIFTAAGLSAAAQSVSDHQLQKTIEIKTQELKEIHRQIEETQENLSQTEQKKRSLSQEIKKRGQIITQLQLNIRANEITVEKLNLEISSLNDSLDRNQEKIDIKSDAVERVLRELQIKGDEELAVVILKNQSLAESLNEIYDLREVKKALSADLIELQILKKELHDNLTQISGKKQGIEREHKTAKARKVILEEEKMEKNQILTLTKNQERLYEQLIDELAKKQAQIAEEIEAMEAELRKQINPNLLPDKRPGVLGWPVQGSPPRVTQNYGATRFARYGYRGKWHNGVDVGGFTGTPVLAAEDGLVVSVGDQDRFCRRAGYGKYIVVKHPNNLTTMYAHLSRQSVSPGDQTKRGEVIGYIGSTGYSTGPHLHFTVYDGNTFQIRSSRLCGPMPSGGDLNPLFYL